MFYLMSGPEGGSPMKEVLVFTPTPNEYKGIRKHLDGASFRNFRARVVESGLGKINAAFAVAQEASVMAGRGQRPAFIVGAGTSGSLSLELASGDVIASSSATISDWRMEDDSDRHYGRFPEINYQSADTILADALAMNCPDPLVEKLMDRLAAHGLKRGRMLTSDTFVVGAGHKLGLGRNFGCLACDMESGAFAYAAQERLGGVPWFNLRVVADTLDDALHDYINMEVDMVDILGARTVFALTTLDELM